MYLFIYGKRAGRGGKGGGGLKNLSVNRQIVFQSAKRELDIETNQNSNRIIKIVELYIPL